MQILALLLCLALSALATTRKSVEYKTTRQGKLSMQIFFPADWKASDRRPAIVFFFGGGFKNGSTRQFFTKAQYLASRGMVAASAEYRISSKHNTTPRESMQDCKSAIRWLRQHASEFGIDPDRLAAGGGSAGATCAVMTSLADDLDDPSEDLSVSSKPAALVLFNPAMELRANDALSPNRFIKSGLPPSVLFFGTADALLAPARTFVDRARAAGNKVQLFLAKEQKHGFFNDHADGDYSWHASTTYASDSFLRSLGYLHGKPSIQIPANSRAILFPEPIRPPQPAQPLQNPLHARVERDIVYARTPEKDLKLDIYLPQPAPPGKLPLLVWVHGGGWQAGSKDRVPALPFLKDGYAVASIAYRFSHEAPFPAQIHDCKAAIRWLRANAGKYGYDPEHIAVWGSSAGGHLVSMLGTSGNAPEIEGSVGATGVPSNVQAVIDYFGPTRLERMSHFPSLIDHDAPDSPENRLAGGFIQQNPELASRVNPITYVNQGDAPFLIFHGDADQLVPLEQSELLHDALRKAKVESTLQVLPGARHGGPEFQTPQVMQQIRDFLKRHIGGAAKGT